MWVMFAQSVQFCYLMIYGLEMLMMAHNILVFCPNWRTIGVIYLYLEFFISCEYIFVIDFVLFSNFTPYFVWIQIDLNVTFVYVLNDSFRTGS